MIQVAIVGAGFAGLATCWHLLNTKRCRVSLFDEAKIGGGASGISTGLLHPYPGEQARRSWKAQEGIEATIKLLKVAETSLGRKVASYQGITRFALNAEQQEHLLRRTREFDDIQQIAENEFLITSGITVYPTLYMEGLWKACQELGALFYPVKISSLEALKDYDAVILACGAGIAEWAPSLEIKLVKGQVLSCLWPRDLPYLKRSLIGKGYLALSENPELCHVGSTFEREFSDGNPNLEAAKKELIPKISAFFPQVSGFSVVGCEAAYRVARRGSYLPLIQRLSEKTWAYTALGSRGLLYHAYFAEQLLQNVGVLPHSFVKSSI